MEVILRLYRLVRTLIQNAAVYTPPLPYFASGTGYLPTIGIIRTDPRLRQSGRPQDVLGSRLTRESTRVTLYESLAYAIDESGLSLRWLLCSPPSAATTHRSTITRHVGSSLPDLISLLVGLLNSEMIAAQLILLIILVISHVRANLMIQGLRGPRGPRGPRYGNHAIFVVHHCSSPE
jgi:hypothetical protein